MALPTSGQLSLSDIYSEVNGSHTSEQAALRTMSSEVGFSTPDYVSDFYGYSSGINRLVATAEGGLVGVSDDNGSNWTLKSTPGLTNACRAIAKFANGDIIVGDWDGNVMISTDDGDTWTSRASVDGWIFVLYVDPTTDDVYAGGNSNSSVGRLWRSGNKGQSWSLVSIPGSTTRIEDIILKYGYWILSGGSGFLYRATDLNNISTWVNISPITTTMRRIGDYTDGNRIIVIGDAATVGYYSDTFGSSWTSFSWSGGGLKTSIVHRPSSSVWLAGKNSGGDYWKSTSNGVTWSAYTATNWTGNMYVNYYDTQSGRWFMDDRGSSYMRYTTNDGTTWTPVSTHPFGVNGVARMIRL